MPTGGLGSRENQTAYTNLSPVVAERFACRLLNWLKIVLAMLGYSADEFLFVLLKKQELKADANAQLTEPGHAGPVQVELPAFMADSPIADALLEGDAVTLRAFLQERRAEVAHRVNAHITSLAMCLAQVMRATHAENYCGALNELAQSSATNNLSAGTQYVQALKKLSTTSPTNALWLNIYHAAVMNALLHLAEARMLSKPEEEEQCQEKFQDFIRAVYELRLLVEGPDKASEFLWDFLQQAVSQSL